MHSFTPSSWPATLLLILHFISSNVSDEVYLYVKCEWLWNTEPASQVILYVYKY